MYRSLFGPFAHSCNLIATTGRRQSVVLFGADWRHFIAPALVRAPIRPAHAPLLSRMTPTLHPHRVSFSLAARAPRPPRLTSARAAPSFPPVFHKDRLSKPVKDRSFPPVPSVKDRSFPPVPSLPLRRAAASVLGPDA